MASERQMTWTSLDTRRKKRRIAPLIKNAKRSSRLLKKMVNFIPLIMLMEKVLLQIKEDPSLKWPKPLTSLPHRQD